MIRIQRKQCFAIYEVYRHPSPMRDKDTWSCKCGNEIVSWNGGVFYSAKMVEDNDAEVRIYPGTFRMVDNAPQP